jgi:hypothetical protein
MEVVVTFVLVVALGAVTGASWWTHRGNGIESAVLTSARTGGFGRPVPDSTFSGPVRCDVLRPGGFEGADVYLCTIYETHGWRQPVLAAMVDGHLHTHKTDPKLIPPIPKSPPPPPWTPTGWEWHSP